MNINITYDTGTSTSGNAMFDAAVNKVTAVIDEMFASNVTINLQFGWGTVNNHALSPGALGQSTPGFIYPVSYSAFQAAATAAGYTVPVTSPFGATPLYTGSAELKALGLAAASTAIDGYIGLSTLAGKAYSWLASDATTITNTQIDIMGTLFHEITEVMGRVSNEGRGTTPYYTPLDLFRYTGTPGVGNAHTLATSGSTNAVNAYFSTDGGITNYGNWNNDSTLGDYGDWIGNSGPGGVYDPNNDNGTLGVFTDIPSSDVRLMKALGWQSYVADFKVSDLTTNAAAFYPLVQPYHGPNASLLFQYVNTTSTDSLTVKANLANELVQLGNGNDTIDFSGIGGTNVAIAGNGNNTFIGGSGTNTFTGGAGNDWIVAGAGADYIDGGTGWNTLSYANSTAAVTVNMLTGTGSGGYAQGDTFTNIQAVVGSSFADTLDGGTGNDTLLGGDGLSLSATQASIYRLYQATLNREPDLAGLQSWDAALNGGQTLLQVTSGFVGSAEFQSTYGALNNTQFVTLLYSNVLHRAPDPGGLANWVNLLNSGASRSTVVDGFSESAEFQNNTSLDTQAYATTAIGDIYLGQVYRLYQATLNRAPDTGGYQSWIGALEGGQTLLQVTSGFVGSAEFQSTYGALDNTQFVTLLYSNVLHRAPDTGGLASWVNLLNSGASRSTVVDGFSESAELINSTNAALATYVQTNMAPIWSDVLDGGLGNDSLFGGLGSNTYQSQVNGGVDQVYGLTAWDHVQFAGFGYANAAAALSHITLVGQDAVFTDQGETITFHHTQLATLQNTAGIFKLA